MASVLTLPEQRVILSGVSWDTYERLLAEHQNQSSTRFVYDCGVLEIMVLSHKHEWINRTIALLIDLLAAESGTDCFASGSTTFRREDLQRGFEPDSCFYFQNAPRVRGKDEIDLSSEPAPDLVIEIDITRPSLNKLPLFASFGVPEVWRYDGVRVVILRLTDDKYFEIAESPLFPGLTSAVVTQFVESARKLERPVWVNQIREWARNRGR
jgi:Uma2 family endonuclease